METEPFSPPGYDTWRARILGFLTEAYGTLPTYWKLRYAMWGHPEIPDSVGLHQMMELCERKRDYRRREYCLLLLGELSDAYCRLIESAENRKEAA